MQSARSCRDYLRRVVRYLTAEAGIRQFLDLGSGLPSARNVHEVAQSIAPESRVVYVDNDHCKSSCAHACWSGCLKQTWAEALKASLGTPQTGSQRTCETTLSRRRRHLLAPLADGRAGLMNQPERYCP